MGLIVFVLSVNVDNGVGVANRAGTVNHRPVVPPDNAAHQLRQAPVPSASSRAEVAFKRLPFYDVLGDVMKPSTLGRPCTLLLTRMGRLHSINFKH